MYVRMLFGFLTFVASFLLSLIGGTIMALIVGSLLGREMVENIKVTASFYLFVVAGYMLGDITHDIGRIVLVSLAFWVSYAIGRWGAVRDHLDSAL